MRLNWCLEILKEFQVCLLNCYFLKSKFCSEFILLSKMPFQHNGTHTRAHFFHNILATLFLPFSKITIFSIIHSLLSLSLVLLEYLYSYFSYTGFNLPFLLPMMKPISNGERQTFTKWNLYFNLHEPAAKT